MENKHIELQQANRENIKLLLFINVLLGQKNGIT